VAKVRASQQRTIIHNWRERLERWKRCRKRDKKKKDKKDLNFQNIRKLDYGLYHLQSTSHDSTMCSMHIKAQEKVKRD
jgi:hypothetical protein